MNLKFWHKTPTYVMVIESKFNKLGNFISGLFNWICRSVQSEKSVWPIVNKLDLETNILNQIS